MRQWPLAIAAVVLAAICFGTTGTTKALLAPSAPAISIGAVRIIIGGVALALLTLPWAQSRIFSLRNLGFATLGGMAVAAYQPTFFFGTERNGVAIGTILALGTAPIFTGLLDWLIRRRFPGTRWCVATAIALAGLVLLAGLTGGTQLDVLGATGSLGAGLSYAVYTLCAKKLIDDGLGSAQAMGMMFGVSAFWAIPLLTSTPLTWLSTPSAWGAVLWLGLITVTLAYILFGYGLARMNAPTVSTITLLEPVTATLLGLLLLSEHISATDWLGIGLLVVALAIISLAGVTTRKHKRETAR